MSSSGPSSPLTGLTPSEMEWIINFWQHPSAPPIHLHSSPAFLAIVERLHRHFSNPQTQAEWQYAVTSARGRSAHSPEWIKSRRLSREGGGDQGEGGRRAARGSEHRHSQHRRHRAECNADVHAQHQTPVHTITRPRAPSDVHAQDQTPAHTIRRPHKKNTVSVETVALPSTLRPLVESNETMYVILVRQ